MNSYCVYKLTFPNNKMYIGITNNFKHRMSQHKSNKKKNKLTNAIKKYGFDNCKKEILICCLTKEKACEFEINFIKQFDSIKNGYNITEGGEISPILTPSVYEKLKRTVKTKKSIEIRRHASLKSWNNKERRALISKQTKLRFQNSEYKENVIKKLTSKESIEKRNKTKRTKEWSEKQSSALKNYYKKGNFVPNCFFTICVETNEVFSSKMEICKKLSTCYQTINRYFSGINSTIKGYTFNKITKDEYLKLKD